MIARVAIFVAASALATPALAQEHHHMPGMVMPPEPSQTPAPGDEPPAAPDPHAGHHAEASEKPDATSDTARTTGDAPAPPAPMDHYADRTFSPAEMARARAAMMRESGGMMTGVVMIDLAEYQIRDGRDGYRWDGEAWFGGDINRLALKSEGEGEVGGGQLDSAEIQALYSRTIGPYFNLQAGVRHDIRPSPSRTYATIGIEGLAPYQFELDGALFLSTKGDLLGRLGGSYDQRITQRLILQPRVELNFAAQDVREDRIGAGLTDAEIGLRLRYEIRREFAPYVGVSWERKVGDTARFAREEGEDTGGFSFVMGIRTWF